MSNQFKNLLICLLIGTGGITAGCNKSEQPSPAATSTSINVKDADVTEHVKTALNQNDVLKRFDIQVITLKGDVRLMGEVETQAQIEEAVKVARAAEGTHSIHNELSIKK